MPKKPRDATPRAQISAMGQAMRAMREAAGPLGDKISASELGQRIGVTRQTIENWEKGVGPVVLRQDIQQQYAAGLGRTREDLLIQYRARIGEDAPEPGHGGLEEAPSRGWPVATSAQTRQVTMPDDTLRPWASSGMTIVYDRNLWPAPDHGVVLEDEESGEREIKIFGHADADSYHCFELYPERRPVAFPRDRYKAYRAIARLG